MTDAERGWEDVTAERARESERRYRLDVTDAFSVTLTVSKSSRADGYPYQLVLATVYEDDGRHVSDHPVAAYADPDAARDALRALKGVVSDVVAERDDLPNPDDRFAHDAIPRFLDTDADAEAGDCRPLYDRTLHG
ncbi:hypothetical protein [Halocalculus aciditolerans]|uniref:Uncharacterized protein n=1 Tax=Halocalculus aciditolerans TaxID=1383812 RepID=A0A830FD70_9EURY|nr:hypothetical protein [Halocalculus aciditolerans]GGL63516.1 hypothetical protein GCM10009039_21800 [Halocalculus aciditolerans]